MRPDSVKEGYPLKTFIEVENLLKRYGSFVAVDDLSLEVAEGEIFGLLGPNGAGKTTAVECIQGLRRPDAGRISVPGLDPRTDTQELRRLIGSQLQESALPDRIKVREALDLLSSFGSGDSKVTGGPQRWEPLLEQWGLAPKRKSSFGSLSGG